MNIEWFRTKNIFTDLNNGQAEDSKIYNTNL
jgi:hypothetical protein